MIKNNQIMFNKCRWTMSEFFYKLYTFLIRREPCILYRRPYMYNKDDKDWYSNSCPFCEIKEEIREETDLFIVLPNIYPYPRTEDHLLVCPKRHIKDWMEMTDEELINMRDLLSKYMKQDYTLLGREFVNNKDASVHHLHMHLIKSVNN